jgi:hypothetical protein
VIDNVKVNSFVRSVYKMLDNPNMTDFYTIHDMFDRLSDNEKHSALLNLFVSLNLKIDREAAN